MPDPGQSHELGSHLSKGIAFLGTEDLKAKIEELQRTIPGDVMVEALRAGAEVIRQALEAITPVGGEYIYHRPEGGKAIRLFDKHSGRARSGTIVYRRLGSKEYGKYAQKTEEAAFLVGYEKRKGYYMYWREYGRKGQPARPFARAAYDSSESAALAAAEQVIAERLR